MINVTKELKGNTLLVRMAGSIEESVNFDDLIGPAPSAIVVNCKEIARINSTGVKAWIKYFQAAQAKGCKLSFQECSTAIVEQVNLISNFACGGTVESIFVPFSCTKCRSELIALLSTEDLKKRGLQIPELPCTKCSAKAVYDDIEEEYFGFLNR